jgi:hypothetical protein
MRARAYREKAEAVRALAASVKDEETREQLYTVAADYDLLAQQFENMRKSSAP